MYICLYAIVHNIIITYIACHFCLGPQTEMGNVLEDAYPIMMSTRAIFQAFSVLSSVWKRPENELSSHF